MTQTITILGATGSIGESTLDVLARHPKQFSIFALTASRQVEKLAAQCLRHQPRYAVMSDAAQAEVLRHQLAAAGSTTEVLSGVEGLCQVASHAEVDMVMAAIVGAAGLLPALAAAEAGKKILLANKETLVMAGDLFMRTARAHRAAVLPVDSEHNAVYQALPKDAAGNICHDGVCSVILTASGGPFLDTELAEFAAITPAMAVKHPKWSMGQKISVDSATMMNKGLEVIEACRLFDLPAAKVEVVVHPQSVIHGMVRYADGSVLAQMGSPDMRTPIAYCLGLPERIESGVASLDFYHLGDLSFRQPDTQRFPCLQLAFDALREGGDAPCVLNAANEVAVAAFLRRAIRFTDIARVVERALTVCDVGASDTIEKLLEKDQVARACAAAEVMRL